MKCVANMYHTTHHMLTSDTVHDCQCTFKYAPLPVSGSQVFTSYSPSGFESLHTL